MSMESWRTTWREGFAPVIPLESLEALRDALERDDPRLIQGSTTTPPPLMCVQDWLCEAGCALGYCGTIAEGGFGQATVGKVEKQFADYCFKADQLLGEPAACRYFLNWFDDTPRDEMRRELLAEVNLAIAERQPEPALA